MTYTISILLKNRYNNAERIIGLFSATGYEIKKMSLSESDAENVSKLVVVADAKGKNVSNFLTRLLQQIRVVSVESAEGDCLTGTEVAISGASAQSYEK